MALKAVLMHVLENCAPKTACLQAQAIMELVNTIPDEFLIGEFTESHISQAWSNDALLQSYRAPLRAAFVHWNEQRYPGLDPNLIRFLKGQRLESPPIGESVRTWDPYTGPLTDIEYASVYDGLQEAFGEGKIERYRFLVSWLTITFGLRPRQLALMKVCDVKWQNADGRVTYSLDVPLIKQTAQAFRAELYEFQVIAEIGKIFVEYAAQLEKHFTPLLADARNAPLFPAEQSIIALLNESMNGKRPRNLRTTSTDFTNANYVMDEICGEDFKLGDGYQYHVNASQIQEWNHSTFSQIHAVSERVKSDFRLNARRFKKTFGTRLAREGLSRAVIARLLCQVCLKSSDAYIAVSSGLHERLDNAMADQLGNFARFFRGELLIDLNDEMDAPVIRDPRIAPGDLGKCKKCGDCGLPAPIACYTCKKYRPWRDGPHAAVLAVLKARRDRRIANSDPAMAALHDLTICAIEEVIELCRQEKNRADPD